MAYFHTIYHGNGEPLSQLPVGSWSQYQTDSVLFFCSSFRGDWMVAEWPWSWMHAPKWYSNMRQQLIGGLTLIFSAEEVYYLQLSADLLFLSSLFLQWKVLFLYIWWLVSSLQGHYSGSCRKLWSNTVARNYCKHYSQCSSHCEVNTMRAYFPRRERWRGSKKTASILSPVKNADAQHFFCFWYINSLKKGFLLSWKIRQW